MSKRLNELAEIVLDRVYTYGYQQRVEVDAQCRAEDDLLAAQRKLADATAERDKLAAELERLRERLSAAKKARDYWHAAFDNESGQATERAAEIEMLRGQLAEVKREASEEFVERQVLQAEASVDIAELERLRAFVGKVRMANYTQSRHDLLTAINDFDDAANPAPVSEPMDAEGGE